MNLNRIRFNALRWSYFINTNKNENGILSEGAAADRRKHYLAPKSPGQSDFVKFVQATGPRILVEQWPNLIPTTSCIFASGAYRCSSEM